MNTVNAKISTFIQSLIDEGGNVCRSKSDYKPEDCVEQNIHSRWVIRCKALANMLGDFGNEFRDSAELRPGFTERYKAELIVATLKGIKTLVDDGLLRKIEGLIDAETFGDLLEQAEHLLSQGYFLAAGVLGRAVLEEHLRKWCDRAGCAPLISRPTIDDYKNSLYKAKHIDKIAMTHVQAMAATGNASAHNDLALNREDVERLLPDVRNFLIQNPQS